MASKQYISIVRLFLHCEIATGAEFNLARAKKQLQAEFSIAKDGFIVIDGYSYSRHDVFEEIERPDFTRRLGFHQMIWENRDLLSLLEKNSAHISVLEYDFAQVSNNTEFDAFFSVYFAGPFNHLSRRFLGELNMGAISELLRYETFLQPAEREEAFRSIRIFLDENIRILRNVNRDNYQMMRPKIQHWIDKDWYLFFNQLPDEFYGQKHEITVMILNLGVAIQKSYRRDCKKMSAQLMALENTAENIREIIVSNHAAYMGSSSSKSATTGGWIVFWAIFIVIRLMASDGCKDSSSSYKYKNTFPPALQYLTDSSLKIVRDSAFSNYFDSIRKANFPTPPKQKIKNSFGKKDSSNGK